MRTLQEKRDAFTPMRTRAKRVGVAVAIVSLAVAALGGPAAVASWASTVPGATVHVTAPTAGK